MPSFEKGKNLAQPVGTNRYLRSPYNVGTDSRMAAAAAFPTETLPSGEIVKVLQPGTVLAVITSGDDIGRVGPFQRGVDGAFEQIALDLSPLSAGTFTLDYDGEVTSAIAFDATAATVEAALQALSNVAFNEIIVTGVAEGTLTIQFTIGGNLTDITVDSTGATGTATATVTDGSASGEGSGGGATDGRQTEANIVGLCDTYLPVQLLRGDREVAVVYRAEAVQDWCLELTEHNVYVPLTNDTADAMRGGKSLDIRFFDSNPEAS
jgi:hypothetical protein